MAVLGYEYLVFATGVSAAFFGVTGAAEHTFSLYTRQDAIILRNRLMDELEKRSGGDDSDLGITIIGGGATGVELAGTLAELRNIALPASFPDIDPKRICVTLIEAGPALLAPFNPKLREYAKRELVKRGVDVRLGTKIERVERDRVFISGGTELASDLTVWAAGISGPEWIGKLGLTTGQGGRLLTGPDLRVVGAGSDLRSRRYRSHRRRSAASALRARDPAGSARRRPDQADRGGPADEAVPLQGQGHRGDDRPPVGRGRAV